jgi:dTDP-4-dehydrorhamnose 3,5-epimerase
VLSETAEFIYKCSDFYAPAEERGVMWNDPDLGIAWPLVAPEPLLSPKDQVYRRLRDTAAADLPAYAAPAR